MENEKEILRLSKKNIKHFDQIYEEFQPRIRAYILKRVNYDEYIADDLCSITFEKAIKGIGKFNWEGIPLSSWLYKIASNTLIDYYRIQGKKASVPINESTLVDKSRTIEQSAVELDGNQRLYSVIREFDKREKNILLLKFYEGYTNKAISAKTGLSETNVSTVIYRAVKKLKTKISLTDFNV